MFLVGEFPDVVRIRRDDVPWGISEGHTAYLGVESKAIARSAVLGAGDADRTIVTRSLISTAAGPLAQAKFMGAPGFRSTPFDWTLFGGERDLEAARRLMDAAGDRLGLPKLDAVVGMTIELLQEPETWGAVERVAGELGRFGELNYLEVRAAAWGL
jgi:hypothetical protein